MPEEFDDEPKQAPPKPKTVEFEFDFSYRNGKSLSIRVTFQGSKDVNGQWVDAEKVAEATISQIHLAMNSIPAINANPSVLLSTNDGSSYLVVMSEVQEVRMKVRS